jgi:HK97 family phage prohead protease
MGAIAVHHTATSTKAWDGPGNKAALKLDQDLAFYSRAFAWRDPEGDEKNKSTYKFIHHDVDAGGNPGAANIKGCQSGIGVLNGAMGGSNIPDADRQGVWRHLAAHLKDAEVTPAELNSISIGELERRCFSVSELRFASGADKKPKLTGYVSLFNKPSEIMGFFREKVDPAAFDNTIQTDDIRGTFNHDPNYVFGRNKAGTLTLAKDSKGLTFEAEPPDTQWMRDFAVSIDRGDINQMSFMFETEKDSWDFTPKDYPMRTLLDVTLHDISIVTFPAYPQTSVKVRDYLNALNEANEELERKGPLTQKEAESSLARQRLNYRFPSK